MSQAGRYTSGSGAAPVETLTGNTGGAVPPTGGNINVVGTGVVSVAGNPGTSTLTISVDDTVATTYDTDSGTATPAGNILDIFGSAGITTSGAGNVVTISTDGSFATTYDTDSGTATPAAGILDIVGASNITTSGVGNTVNISVAGTTNHCVQVGNASGSLTSLAAATNGQLVIGSTGVDPVVAALTAGSNISITNGAGSITIAANAASQVVAYTAVAFGASPYTVLSTDYYIGANVTGGAITIRLPNAPTTGRIFAVKDVAGLAASNNITVTTVGGVVTIDGGTSFVMNTAYESVSLIFNSTSYEIY